MSIRYTCNRCDLEFKKTKEVYRGSYGIGFILLFLSIPLFCIPGVFYFLWMNSTGKKVCPECESGDWKIERRADDTK